MEFNGVWGNSDDFTVVTLEKDDVIDFSTAGTETFYLFFDDDIYRSNDDVSYYGEYASSCYGNGENCRSTFVVPNKMIVTDFALGFAGNDYRAHIGLISVDDNQQIITSDELQEGKLFKGGSIIVYRQPYHGIYYFDEDENYILGDTFYYAGVLASSYHDNSIYQYTSVEDSQYAGEYYYAFKKIRYTSPEFSLKCEKNSIQYGEKTSCSVCVTSIEQLNEVSYNLNIPNFKVSNVVPGTHTTPFEGSSEYNYRIDSGYAVNGEEFVLMTFDLEGTKNESYLDNVSIVGIYYQDNVYSGSYDNVVSDLRIVPGTHKNPNTWNNLFIVIVPFITLLVAAFYRKKKRVS